MTTLLAGGAVVVNTPNAGRAASPTMSFQVPTTKVLAIGNWTDKSNPSTWRPLVPKEMRQTAELYLDGRIDQWYVKPDQSGVVFIMNVTTASEAHALLEKLPLGIAGQMRFQLIPLGPLSPLRALLRAPPG